MRAKENELNSIRKKLIETARRPSVDVSSAVAGLRDETYPDEEYVCGVNPKAGEAEPLSRLFLTFSFGLSLAFQCLDNNVADNIFKKLHVEQVMIAKRSSVLGHMSDLQVQYLVLQIMTNSVGATILLLCHG